MYRDFFTDQAKKSLQNYKYHPGVWTKLDLVMNHWWEWCMNYLIPSRQWIAPNAISLFGMVCSVGGFAIFMVYDLSVSSESIPAFCYLLSGILMFTYITMDACDGKQAKKLGASSPLGQLFDHGCDAISVYFYLLAFCQATNMAQFPWMFKAVIFAGFSSFFLSNWNEHHSGVLNTSIGGVGVTEMEMMDVFAQVVAFCLGTRFAGSPLNAVFLKYFGFSTGLEIFDWVSINVIGNSTLLALAPFGVVTMILRTLSQTKRKVYALSQIIPFAFIFYMLNYWMDLEEVRPYYCLPVIMVGLVFSVIMYKLIICTLTKMDFTLVHFELAIPMAVTACSLAGVTGETLKWLVVGAVIFNVVIVACFYVSVMRQIAGILNISILGLSHLKKKNK